MNRGVKHHRHRRADHQRRAARFKRQSLGIALVTVFGKRAR